MNQVIFHTAMGGAGSVEHWAALQPPLAQRDLTHFTNEGYNLLGRYIAGGIMKPYDSGPESMRSASLERDAHEGDLLPPLFSEIKGSGALSAGATHFWITSQIPSNPWQCPRRFTISFEMKANLL